MLKQNGECGWSNFAEGYRDFFGFSFELMFSPNPATNETTISIESKSELEFDKNAEWEIEVYNNSQGLKKKKTKLKGKNTVIQTTGWKTGIYIVQVKYKNMVLHGKLLIKK